MLTGMSPTYTLKICISRHRRKLLICLGGRVPIYEYQCTNCHHLFDLKQGFDADPIQSCPLCKSPSNRKLHAPTVIYKGSGFYTTDYARKDPPTPGSDAPSDTPEKEISAKDDSD